jgi:hypothetical protein
VPLARHEHIGVAIQSQLDRPPASMGQHCRGSGDQRGLGFLAAEATAHAPASYRDVIRTPGEHVRHHLLDLGGVLRRAVDQHGAILLRQRYGDVSLEVEMILPADRERTAQAMRAALERLARLAAHQPLARQQVALCRQRGADIQNRR